MGILKSFMILFAQKTVTPAKQMKLAMFVLKASHYTIINAYQNVHLELFH